MEEILQKIEELKNCLLTKDWFGSDFAGWEGKLIDLLINIVNNIPAMSGWEVVDAAPETPTSPGKKGNYYIDGTNEMLYVCVDENKWLRAILTTWPNSNNFNNDMNNDFTNG